MIRVVLDTNIIISGSLWSGTPHHVISLAKQNRINALTSETILDELRDVLQRPKFAERLAATGQSVEAIVDEYLHYAAITEPAAIASVIERDPDDDAVLACALGGDAQFIVTGDEHLLALQTFRDIQIMDAHQFLNLINENDL